MKRKSPARDWWFWVLLGLFALVLVLQLAAPQLDSDQAVTGLMGLHILRGEFPIFFWKQDHAGVPESYGAAVAFFLFGPSRLTLSLVPALAALGLVLAVYRTGAVLFGRGAGLLGILFTTVVSPYVATHYVLARAYYIEQLLVGQIVLLGAALWLMRPLSEGARARVLIAMGLAGGVGLYFNFQIVDTLVPATGALLLVDPRLPLRRSAWLGLGAFILGSAPFWLYNLTHDWATFATGARFQGSGPAGEAAQALFLGRLPVLLGVRDHPQLPPHLPGVFALAAPTVVAAAVLILAVRVIRGLPHLRRDPALAGEAMLLAAVVVTVAVVWYWQFLKVPRYLLPLIPVLALVLGRASQLVWRRMRILAVLGVVVYVGAVGIGLLGDLAVLWPERWTRYQAERAEDEALFRFLHQRGLRYAYSYEYWLAPRLTFDAREGIIVAEPFNGRHPPYTAAVDAATRPAYIIRGDTELFENWMRGTGTRWERDRIGPYAIYRNFTPPPPVVSLSRAEWTLRTGPGAGAGKNLADGQLASGWVSAPGPPGSAWVEVDLGRTHAVTGVTLVADRPGHTPSLLEVAVVDGAAPGPRLARLETRGFAVAWRNGAPRTRPGHTVTVRFAPVEARRLRVTDFGSEGTWAVRELFVLAPSEAIPDEAGAAGGLVQEGRRLEANGAPRTALARYHDAMQVAPDAPEGYAEFTRLALEGGLYDGYPAERATRYLELGLPDEAKSVYADLAAAFGPDRRYAELAERRARVAAMLGDPAAAQQHRAEAVAVLAPPHPAAAVFDGVAELTGYGVTPERLRTGESVELALHWRLVRPSSAGLAVYVHFQGPTRFGDDRPLPPFIEGLTDGPQHLVERRRVIVPLDARPGAYRIVVGVWDPTSGRQVRLWWHELLPTSRHLAQLGVLEVLPRP